MRPVEWISPATAPAAGERSWAGFVSRRPVGVGLVLLWVVVAATWFVAPGVAVALALGLGVATAALLAYILRVVVRPTLELAERAEHMAVSGEDTLASPCAGIAEVETLRRALNAMAGHVRRAHSSGSAHAAAISAAQETERERLAHELHDATVQSLIAVAQRLDRAGRAVETDPQRAHALIAGARQDITGTISGLRDIIADLRPPALDELGLVPALELTLRRLPPMPPVRLRVEGAQRRLDPDRELAVLRIVQEGLSNVRRHARASRADVTLRFDGDALHVMVEDDGTGFVRGDEDEAGHWGLIGIMERAARFGGTVDIDSAPGEGTRLRVVIPDQTVAQPATEVVDPVCHAQIQPDTAYGSTEYEGTAYYFCCPVCQGAFGRDPDRYAI